MDGAKMRPAHDLFGRGGVPPREPKVALGRANSGPLGQLAQVAIVAAQWATMGAWGPQWEVGGVRRFPPSAEGMTGRAGTCLQRWHALSPRTSDFGPATLRRFLPCLGKCGGRPPGPPGPHGGPGAPTAALTSPWELHAPLSVRNGPEEASTSSSEAS